MIILYIAGIILEAGIIVFFIRRGRQQAKQKTGSVIAPADNTYEGLRTLALQVTPGQLKLAIPGTETLVYGMVMDWDTGDVMITLSAYITGAANICFSTGGVIAGGGKNPNAGEAAVEFVLTAQEYMERAMPVTATDLPSKGCVRFYFLTNKGMYAAQEQAKHFKDGSSAWLSLFEKGSLVINEISGGGNGTH